MLDQKILLIAVIAAAVAVLADVVWKAVYAIKHKGDEKALEVMTKAQAASSWTLWLWLILGGGFATILFKEGTAFSLNSVGTFTFILLGIQCVFELCAGYYYTWAFRSKVEGAEIGRAKTG